MQTEDSSPGPSAEVVGNVFVEQYYLVLYQSPELVYRFYHDSSVLSRPGSDGVMTTVTTSEGINDMILSFDYKGHKAEILTADAQFSYKDGVVVLVTGCLTGKDNVRRKFTQSFFLAPQDNGYFVLNDVFRYMDERESLMVETIAVNDVNENSPVAPLTPEPESTHVLDHPKLNNTSPMEEDAADDEEVCDPTENEGGPVSEEKVVCEIPVDPSKDVHPVSETVSAVIEEDAPKKSYASIVKVMKGEMATSSVHVPPGAVRAAKSNAKVSPANIERHVSTSAAPRAQVHSSNSTPSGNSAPSGNNAPSSNSTPTNNGAPRSNISPESGQDHPEVGGHSIYIGNLPLNATVQQVEGVFKKFGPIISGGIQIRSYKGYGFGFVEFESLDSMHSAIKASPITIGGHQATIEQKKTTLRVGNDRGRPSSGRGGYRNDNFRGRGNFGGRGYGRNEFGNRGEFYGRGRAPNGRNSDPYQRDYQNRGGRV